jgi:anti-sigma-K factor RskA
MERHGIHELSAAYALHALDPDEERTYEDHLAHCAECRNEVASFQEVAGELAHAVGIGIWAASLSSQLEDERAANARSAQVFELAGARGSLIVTPAGDATLVVKDLRPAPPGKTYEAWVIQRDVARPAGLFPGGQPTAFALTRPVPRGAVVAVTLEVAGGVDQPTAAPLFTAKSA